MNRRLLWIGLAGVAFIAIIIVVVVVLRNRDVGIPSGLLVTPGTVSRSTVATSSASVYDMTPAIQAELDRQKQDQGKFPADYQSAWTAEQIQAEKEADANRGFRPTSTTP